MTVFHVIQHSGDPVWMPGAPLWIAKQFDTWIFQRQDLWPIGREAIDEQIARLRLEYEPDVHGKEVVKR